MTAAMFRIGHGYDVHRLESGRDLIFGGARYNSSGAAHVGFADAVDSLNAVRAVFDSGRYSMRELVDAVKADFNGYEELRQYVLNHALKYGTRAETERGESRGLIKFLYDVY